MNESVCDFQCYERIIAHTRLLYIVVLSEDGAVVVASMLLLVYICVCTLQLFWNDKRHA